MHIEMKIDRLKTRNWFQMLQLCARFSAEMVTVSSTVTEEEVTARIVVLKQSEITLTDWCCLR